MKICFLLLVLLLDLGATAFAQLPTANWLAVSHTAEGITGNVRTTPSQLAIGNSVFRMRPVRKLETNDVVTLYHLFSLPSAAGASGKLYSIHIEGNKPFKNGNTLCGREAVTFAVLLISPPSHGNSQRGLNLAFFSGNQVPDLGENALRTSTNLCGTYGYVQSGLAK